VGILDTPVVRRTRRNHALEHATIHILSARHPKLSMAGRAVSKGLRLCGVVDTDEVRSAVEEALSRLEGEPELAVHPLCGTNIVVGGAVAGLLSLVALATLPEERKPARALDVLPRLMLAGTFAAVASQPLGPKVQERLTTLPVCAGVTVAGITRQERRGHVIHRVLLADAA
jgi:hypothetical protein